MRLSAVVCHRHNGQQVLGGPPLTTTVGRRQGHRSGTCVAASPSNRAVASTAKTHRAHSTGVDGAGFTEPHHVVAQGDHVSSATGCATMVTLVLSGCGARSAGIDFSSSVLFPPPVPA